MAPTRRAAKAEPDSPAKTRAAAATAADDDIANPQSEETTVAKRGEKEGRKAVPELARFPLAVALSFALASLGYSLVNELSNKELGALNRTPDTWAEVGLLSGWRLAELALGWYGGFDSLDVATLDLLAHGPTIYLQAAFYNLSWVTAAAALSVDVISIALPFYLLRPLAAIHTPSAKVPNGELIDAGLQVYTTALATSIYSVILVTSLRFVLPRILVLYFNGVPSIEPAYAVNYAGVLPVTLLFGLAGSTFVFAPFATAGRAKDDDRIAAFDPVEATLGQTVWWNLWGYTSKTKVVIRRTAVAVVVTALNTYLACTKTLYGVEPAGAATYAAVWALAALCTGLGLGFVGKD